MKLSSQFWSKVGSNCPSTFLFASKKQTENRAGSLAGSVVDKETPFYKPISLLIPTLLVIITFTIIPLFFNIKQAFFDEATGAFTIKEFEALFQEANFAVGMRNSLMYGILVLPFVMMISLVISSCIATLIRKWAKGLWQTVFFLPYMTNIVAVSLAFIQFFSPQGLFNHLIGSTNDWLGTGNGKFSFKPLLPILIQGIWSGLAFNILISTTAMLSVDKNLYRSASIDGVGSIKQFFRITLPSIKSTTTFLITMGIINGIKVFPLALFENKPVNAFNAGASTMMLYVYNETGQGHFGAAATSAISLFGIGLIYSYIVRGGFDTIMKVSLNLGESNV